MVMFAKGCAVFCGVGQRRKESAEKAATIFVGRTSSFVSMGIGNLPPPIASCYSPLGEIADWRAVCGRSACTVRREERRKPMRLLYPYGQPWVKPKE